MDRQEIMEVLADWFEIEPDEDGKYDIDSYDWQSGAYLNNHWLSLAEVVNCIEERF